MREENPRRFYLEGQTPGRREFTWPASLSGSGGRSGGPGPPASGEHQGRRDHAVRGDPLDHEAVAWARDAWDALRPFATGGVYIDFSGLDEEADELRDGVFGQSLARLKAVREAHDPEGLFEAASRRP